MDKVISARIDESVARRITALARQLHTSKKRVIEEAIRTFAATVEEGQKSDPLEQTHGAWQRKESAEQLVTKARRAFRGSMRRHRR